MKKLLLSFSFLFVSISSIFAQDSSLFFFTRLNNNGFSLNEVNVFTDQATLLSPSNILNTTVMNSMNIVDSKNEILYLCSPNALNGVDLKTGLIKNSFPNNDFNLMEYDCKSSKIYCLTRNSSNKFLFSSINPTNGSLNIISTMPVANIISSGGSSLNAALNEYYFLEKNTGSSDMNLKIIDITNGSIKATHKLNYSFNLIKFNPTDGHLYGVVLDVKSKLFKLAKIDPTTGYSSLVSTNNLLKASSTTAQLGLAISANAALDIKNQIYYFQSVEFDQMKPGKPDMNILRVDLKTGQVISKIVHGEMVYFMGIKNDCNATANNGGSNNDNNSNSISMDVFPNPSKGQISFMLPDSTENNSIVVYNSSGNQVHSEKLQPNLEFNTTILQSGIYYIQLVNANGNVVAKKKFMVE